MGIDQPLIANEFSRHYHVAWELYQVRRGPGVGRKTSTGVVVEGTEEAMKRELRDVFEKMRGREGEELRSNVRELRETVSRTRREGGKSHGEIKKLSRGEFA